MNVRIHPTAIIEDGVSIGEGTSVWDNVHIRHSTSIGEECIVGEELAYGCSGIQTALMLNQLAVLPVLIAGSPAQKKK